MRPLISRLRAPRTPVSHLARLVVVRTVGSLLVLGAILFGQALVVQTSAGIEVVPTVTPSWSPENQEAYPQCVGATQWPHGALADAVVAYEHSTGVTSLIDFDRAWERTHNSRASDDLTVLGICA